MQEDNNLILMMRMEKARNALRFSLNQICAEYDLPGYLLDMILYSVLSEELQQRISMLSEMVNFEAAPEPPQEGENNG